MTIAATAPSSTEFLGLLALAIAVCWLGGSAAQRLGQPRVVGEILGGVLCGLLPAVFPQWMTTGSYAKLQDWGTVGLCLFCFQVGLETRLGLFVRGPQRRPFAAVLTAGLVIPFLAGGSLGWLTQTSLHEDASPFFPALIALALSITAMPVLARILQETGLNRRLPGQLAMSCAVVDDLVGWLLMSVLAALVVAGSAAAGIAGGLLKLLLLVAGTGAAAWVLKTVFRKSTSADLLFLAGLGAVIGAAFASWLHLPALQGAYFTGLWLSRQPALAEIWETQAARFVERLLLPVFFCLVGTRLQLGAFLSPGLLLWLAVFLAVAVLSKLGACYAAARWAGLPSRDALTVGALMNTRGILGLVVADFGRIEGIIGPEVYTLLVSVAVVTTLMTLPLLRLAGFRSPIP